MKIVFFCIPAHGHTNPTLPVVRELVNRGHQVWYYSYDLLREKIEAAGATFVSCDPYDRKQALTPQESARLGKDLAFSTQILVDTTLALDDMVCSHMQDLRPDCIVADSMAVWGKAVAQKLGIPFVSSTTTFAFNQHSAKIMKQSPGQLFGMFFSMPRLKKEIKRLQSKGYPVKNVLDIIQNDDKTHTVVYTSPGFQPCADTFSPNHYAFVGPSIRPASGRVEKTREQLVYVSMGTVNNDMIPLYQACIQGLSTLGCQVILSVGSQVDPARLGPLPGHMAVYPQVDQIAVLEQADAFLSHCGMNSASESLYFGVPLAMLPQTSEQRGVAERIRQLGAGILLQETTPAAIAQTVRTLLEAPTYRTQAKAIARDFRSCPGPKGAADKILQVCGGEISPEN